MKSWRYRVAAAATCSGLLVGLTGAVSADGQQRQTPVAVSAQPAAQPQQPLPAHTARKAGFNWDALGMRGFSVALVLGDLAGAATPDNLPAGAKKALSDMRDFLPYKSYRLLDTHWILCCSGSMSPSVFGRLRGDDEQEYAFNIDVQPMPANSSELSVRFNLREVASAAEHFVTAVTAADRAQQQVDELKKRQRQELERRPGQPANPADEAAARIHVEETKRRQAELERGARTRVTTARSGHVLDSTFSMKVGETVVIGTSRLKGEKALIAVLTAASRNTTPPSAR